MCGLGDGSVCAKEVDVLEMGLVQISARENGF